MTMRPPDPREDLHGQFYQLLRDRFGRRYVALQMVTWHKLVFKPLANTLASANPAGLTSEERQTVEDAKSAIPLLVDVAEQGADEEV
ncbi:hypothetical protein RTBOTA2_006975 [Rhodotorula toruloides]|nr:hypothetical protein RTBOTA2_006975 [Rhodotorula toruloides]